MEKNKFIRKIYPEKSLKRIQSKLDMLGDIKYDAVDFMNVRVITTAILFILIIYKNSFGYIFAPFISLLYYIVFYYVGIVIPLNKRSKKIDREALYFFEILTLTLESGRNLERSLIVTVDNVNSELSDEFARTLAETHYGKTLIEALNDMKKRIPSETVNNIILNMTQTSIFGCSIVDTLYSQVDFLRDKQSLEIKGQINKIPNKISIVSVIFVVPLILVLILGPFLLTYLS